MHSCACFIEVVFKEHSRVEYQHLLMIKMSKIQKQSILLWKDIIKNKSNASADATAVEEFPVKQTRDNN